ncbi:hypothetical protein HGA88_07005 [Candidatus Roizmanbacteria bacterium]|nr:hypothetical protein [Candidatus Roizmanbacteria bacterium]
MKFKKLFATFVPIQSSILLVCISLIIYLPSLSFFFVGDDFANLTFHPTDIILVRSGHNHFFPLSWLILTFFKYFFGTNAFFYHALIVTIFIINVLLVKRISAFFLKEEKLQFLTAVLFASFFANYEIVFWISTIFLNTSLLFYLAGFYFFATFLNAPVWNKQKARLFLLFSSFSLLAILAQEYGISLVLLCLVYMWHRNVRWNVKGLLQLFSIPVGTFLLISITKLLIVTISLTPSAITPLRATKSFFTFFSYSLYPNPYAWELLYQMRKLYLPFIGVILVLGVLFFIGVLKYKNKKQLAPAFLLLVGNCFMLSVTSVPQMRYFYYLAFPSALMWSLFLKDCKYRLVLIAVTIFLIVPQFFFIQERMGEWGRASNISRHIVQGLTKENGCQKVKRDVFPPWIGDDRYKAYIIAHPHTLMVLFHHTYCQQ